MADTIFAQATPGGRAGVAVIRISGPSAHDAACRLAGPALPPRRASLRTLRDPHSGEGVDQALLLHFPAPASYTGEAVVEIHCHGSPAVTRRLVHLLSSMTGMRLARPGEFTRRAVENGRLDLAQVEGLADLLAAETEAQRRQALAVASGALSARVARWRSDLVEVLALVEAVIDFGDEGVSEAALTPIPGRLRRMRAEMEGMLEGSAAAERIRGGFSVALCGAPNVGKSTLLNAIAGREVALTSEVAGTTRDVLEVHLDLHGLPVTLLDTAGIRESEDALERLGIARARARSDSADLRIFLVEPGHSVPETQKQKWDIVLMAKGDLHRSSSPAVSGLTGAGVDDLLEQVFSILRERAEGSSGLPHERQKLAVREAVQALARASAIWAASMDNHELFAFELRGAVRALDVLTGKVDVEAVLDQVFARFCLGK